MSAAAPQTRNPIKKVMRRALVAAHLLTRSAADAEKVVMQAIEAWDPDEENTDVLFRSALRLAVAPGISANLAEADRCCLPAEMKAVLDLPDPLRRSFVVRTLAGLPLEDCAQLLNLDGHDVEQYALLAISWLAAGSGSVSNGWGSSLTPAFSAFRACALAGDTRAPARRG